MSRPKTCPKDVPVPQGKECPEARPIGEQLGHIRRLYIAPNVPSERDDLGSHLSPYDRTVALGVSSSTWKRVR